MKITMSGIVRVAVLGLVVAAMGCERSDPRLKNLRAGMGKDSVAVAMEGSAAQRTDPYLYKGQYIQTMYFPRKGKTDSASLADRAMAPIIMIDGKVTGWGWDYWDSVATANHIPVAKKN